MLNSSRGLSPLRPLQSESVTPGHATVSAAGKCTRLLAVRGRAHVSVVVQAVTYHTDHPAYKKTNGGELR